MAQKDADSVLSPDGKGAGPIKPLDGSAIVRDADKSKSLAIVHNGAAGGAMPAWKGKLSETEIAAVVTFTKNGWSNKTGQVVQPAEVMAQRYVQLNDQLARDREQDLGLRLA